MDSQAQHALQNLHNPDRAVQSEAFFTLLAITDQPVDWAYQVWDELLVLLRHNDNHLRAIAAQLLCNLAKSDPQERMITDVTALLALTKDERFVTARHCMQALWKVGITGQQQRQALIAGLVERFHECSAEKNCTLIRYDILQSLKQIYDVVQDEAIKQQAVMLIASETDLKYQKKYASLWPGKRSRAS